MTVDRADRLRRLLGVGMVLLVALAVPAVARWGGLWVSGSPTIARTVVVPRPGDCLAALVGPTPPLRPLIFGISAAVVDEPATVFADCAGAHVGEVVALRRTPVDADGFGAAGAGTAGPWCTQVAVGYRELLRWQVAAVAGEVWTPVVAHRFIAVVDDSGADRWAACVVLAPGLERYRGSYVSSLAGTAAPTPFGSCRSGAAAGLQASCDMPHDQQIFGVLQPGATPTWHSCAALVRRVTGMVDLTGGGRLGVWIDDPGAKATCRVRVVGPERLTGTLLGLGDAPLPLGTG